MSSNRRSLQIELFGYTLTVVSDAPDSHVDELVSLIEARLAPIQKSAPHAPPVEIALLGALNIAEDLLQTQAELTVLRAEVQARGDSLKRRLDALEVDLGLRAAPKAAPSEAPLSAPPLAEDEDEARTDIPA